MPDSAEFEPAANRKFLLDGAESRPISLWRTKSQLSPGRVLARLGGGLISIGLVVWVVAVLVQHSSASTTITRINMFIAHSAHDDQTFAISRAMRFAALLGSPKFTAALVVMTGLAMRVRMKTWRPLWILAFVYVGSLILELALKLTIVRGPSPSGMVAAGVSSFPSGHSLRSAAIYGALADLFGELRRDWRRRLWTVAVLLAVATGISVAYLGWHRSTDVIGGWTMGAAWLVMVIWVMTKRKP